MQYSNRPDRQDEFSRFGRDTLRELRVRRTSPMPDARDAFHELKGQVLQALTADLGHLLNPQDKAASRILLQKRLDAFLAEENIIFKEDEKRRLVKDVVSELLGFGPLEPLLILDGIDQIVVKSPEDIFIERHGQRQRVQATFEDNTHMMRIIERIIAPTGQHLGQDSPILDTRMPDGSQVHIEIPSGTSGGPTITIKCAAPIFYTMQELCDLKLLTDEIADFLHAAVIAHLNIIITGLPETGKTTLLRALCSFVPMEEHIVTIEETTELHLDHDHVLPMETRRPAAGGKNSISAKTLIMATARIRPDRLILGSIQGDEAFAWLQVINAGLDGSMTTSNGESAQDFLARIELMARLGSPHLPQHLIRSQIASAVDLIVHLERVPDNTLKVVSISEVTSVEGDHFVTADIFRFEQTGLEDGQNVSALQSTGVHSYCAQRIRDAGISLHPSLGI